jgi:hypothetical protein
MNLKKLCMGERKGGLLWITMVVFVSSCGTEKPIKPIDEVGLSKLTEQILFKSTETQDYQSALKYLHSVHDDSLSGEEKVLHGLAHIYQGEVYEVAAKILSEMQLDLYHQSIDPDHGMKFPIIKKEQLNDIKDELSFWMGIDAYAVYGKNEGDALMASTVSDSFYKIKQSVIQSYKRSSDHYSNQTMMGINDNISEIDKMPILIDIIEAGKLFENQEYKKVLSFLDEKKLYNKNIFRENKHVQYYSPSVFKLAALSHYKLGIKGFEEGIKGDYTTQDSTIYKLIGVMNLGQKYHYFKEAQKISLLWENSKQMFIANNKILRRLVESKKIKMPYSLDWVLFENAVQSVINIPLPISLQFLNDGNDTHLRAMKKMIVKKNNNVTQNEIQLVLKEFKNDPKKMDNYPTLMSGFISALNLSDFAISKKHSIQDVSESLVFPAARANASWQRNRPAFLLSLYGTLRWQGGRLPDCNEFLFNIKKLNERMGALDEVVRLFSQELLK